MRIIKNRSQILNVVVHSILIISLRSIRIIIIDIEGIAYNREVLQSKNLTGDCLGVIQSR